MQRSYAELQAEVDSQKEVLQSELDASEAKHSTKVRKLQESAQEKIDSALAENAHLLKQMEVLRQQIPDGDREIKQLQAAHEQALESQKKVHLAENAKL